MYYKNSDYQLAKDLSSEFTMWKFRDFSVIPILREINFGES